MKITPALLLFGVGALALSARRGTASSSDGAPPPPPGPDDDAPPPPGPGSTYEKVASRVRFQGVPFAVGDGRAWPVVSSTGETSYAVPYLGADGAPVDNARAGMSADRYFGALRDGGKRRHAGVDVLAPDNSSILAMEPGIVLGPVTGFPVGGLAIRHLEFVAIYAEIVPVPWMTPGTTVRSGDWIGRGFRSEFGQELHLETWDIARAPRGFVPWRAGEKPPAGLLDPTVYLLDLAAKAAASKPML